MELQFLKCPKCGQIVLTIKNKPCDVHCCGVPMEVLVPGTSDGAYEKHVPVFEQIGNQVNVTVGSVEHPMLDVHYIEWIALETKKGAQFKKLAPGEAPKASFLLTEDDELVAVYEYCNLHGLWKA
ncbi:MAG: desulfoferrodoxin [Lachnospiraceae bacterium]|nr:desulfoferrodoxin [Lachnospiraceae bacterium]